MTDPVRISRLMVAAAALMLLAGCTNNDSETENPTTTQAAPATEPAPTTAAPTTTEAAATTSAPPTLSPAEQDEGDVEATVMAYSAALSGVFEGDDVEAIYPWSRDVAREQWTTQALAYREQGLVIEGRTSADVREVEVNGDQADVLACVDYSGTTVTDANGQDITPDRASGDRILNDYVLVREASAEHGWVVVDDTSRSEPCDN